MILRPSTRARDEAAQDEGRGSGDQPRALDLFCGAGGASMGLHRAGFEVTGADVRPQPRYPFGFVQADALAPPFDLAGFDLIWASPPCQAYSSVAHSWRAAGRTYPDLIEPVRTLLSGTAALTVIENVPGAPLRPDVVLDGTMFPGLKVIRKRLFETNFFMLRPGSRIRPNLVAKHGYATVCGGGRCSGVPKAANSWHTAAATRAAMGIDWMTRRELAQAIPPAYAEFIGRAALAELEARAELIPDPPHPEPPHPEPLSRDEGHLSSGAQR